MDLLAELCSHKFDVTEEFHNTPHDRTEVLAIIQELFVASTTRERVNARLLVYE